MRTTLVLVSAGVQVLAQVPFLVLVQVPVQVLALECEVPLLR